MAGSRLGHENLSGRRMCRRIKRPKAGGWGLDPFVARGGYEYSPTPNCKLTYNI